MLLYFQQSDMERITNKISKLEQKKEKLIKKRNQQVNNINEFINYPLYIKIFLVLYVIFCFVCIDGSILINYQINIIKNTNALIIVIIVNILKVCILCPLVIKCILEISHTIYYRRFNNVCFRIQNLKNKY